MKRKLSTFAAFTLLTVLIFLAIFGTLNLFSQINQQSQASSKSFDSSEYRVHLDDTTFNIAQIPRKTFFYAYAKTGESLVLGSSAIGIGNGDILLTSPTGQQSKCTDLGNSAGLIRNISEETAGPLPSQGGFQPCIKTINSENESGIWKIQLTSPKPNTELLPALTKKNDPWVQQNNVSSVASWYVAVHNSNDAKIAGRTYAKYLSLNLPSFELALSLKTYILTREGYLYKFDTNGMMPHGFILFSNNKGFQNESGEPIYKSLNLVGENFDNQLPPGTKLHLPNLQDGEGDFTHKIFFELPDPNMPAVANSAEGQQWLYKEPWQSVEPSNFRFENKEGLSNQLSTNGGVFKFNLVANASYKITIDSNQDGIFGNDNDQILGGSGIAGENQVEWSIQQNQENQIESISGDIKAQLQVFQGEVHFPFLDVENNPRGIILERLAPADQDPTKMFYNDLDLPGANEQENQTSSTEGVDSSDGAHAFSNFFGDIKAIDTWSYIASRPILANLSSNSIDLATQIQHNPERFTQGQSATFDVKFSNQTNLNTQANPININLDQKYSNINWTCTVIQGTGNCSKVSGNTNDYNQNLDLGPNSEILIKINLAVASDATEDIKINSLISSSPGFIDSNLDNNQASDQAPVDQAQPANQAPTAIDDQAQTEYEQPVLIDVLNNDSDPENDLRPDTLKITNATTNGQLNITSNQVNYTPNQLFSGNDSFEYEICDGQNLCDKATVTIVVNPRPPVGPTANPDSFTTTEDTPFNINLQNELASNDTDPDNDLNLDSITLTSYPSNGSISQTNNPNLIIYTPNSNFTGQDKFDYEICDQTNLCSITTVTIDVTPENDPPVAVNDQSETDEDTPVEIRALDNDSDPDNNLDLASLEAISNPTHGTIQTTPTNTFVYTPSTNYVGPDQFSYKICDTEELCDEAIVYIQVKPTNDPPVAVNDTASTVKNNPINIPVKNNDSDPDDSIDDLTVDIVTAPNNGQTSLVAGSVIYTPNQNFVGSDTFTYNLCDPARQCSQAQVDVVVSDVPLGDPGVKNPPQANPDNLDIPQNTSDHTIIVLNNDTDPDNNLDSQTLVPTSQPKNGTIKITQNGFEYTPTFNFSGVDNFNYQVCDTTNLCSQTTVNINVSPSPIKANDDVAQTPFATNVEIDVLVNDEDIDPNSPSNNLTILTGPNNGNISTLPNNKVLYEPNGNFSGTDRFTYQICKSANQCDSADVTISVGSLPFTLLPRSGGLSMATFSALASVVISLSWYKFSRRKKLKIT